MRKKWKCDEGCACTQLKVAEFEVEHNQRVHRHHVYDSGFLHGNCRVSFDLEFKLEFRIYVGICHDPDFTKAADCLAELTQLLDKLRKLGLKLKGLTDPDEIWKRIGGVSPKALRESPSVEKPRRIRRRRRSSRSQEGQKQSSLPRTETRSNELSGQRFAHVCRVLEDAGVAFNLDYVRTTDPGLVGTVLNVQTDPDTRTATVLVAVTPPSLTDIEEVAKGYAARLNEAHITDLSDLATVASTDVKIRGVSTGRLERWAAMARWLLSAPFLDGNGAEILVRGLKLTSLSRACEWLRDKDQPVIEAEIAAASEQVKLPSGYLETHSPLLVAALRDAARVERLEP